MLDSQRLVVLVLLLALACAACLTPVYGFEGSLARHSFLDRTDLALTSHHWSGDPSHLKPEGG